MLETKQQRTARPSLGNETARVYIWNQSLDVKLMVYPVRTFLRKEESSERPLSPTPYAPGQVSRGFERHSTRANRAEHGIIGRERAVAT